MNKYEMLQDDKIEVSGHILYRIRALKDFKGAKAGDLGGYIEGEKNLSHRNNCWVYGSAYVYDNAHVYGNARVCDSTCVFGNARVYGSAYVFGNAHVFGNARVCDNACVFDNAHVYGNARVCDSTCVYGNAHVYDNAHVYGNARVCDSTCVYGNAHVYGNARVCGNAYVFGNARVFGNAKINKISDVLCISPIGSRNDVTTFFKTENGNICVKCGCFSGTIDRFLETVNKTHGENKHAAKAYKLACELARVQIELED